MRHFTFSPEVLAAIGHDRQSLGAVLSESEARPNRAEIEAILPRFTGSVMQTPPAYSALKISGRLPCVASHASISALQNLSGSESASRPGRP